MKRFITLLLSVIIIPIGCFACDYKIQNNLNYRNDNYKHKIDIEEENCINNSDVTEYIICSEKANSAWEDEIQEKLQCLKKIMSANEYRKIEKMHKEWEKSVYIQTGIINRFIMTKDGIIYKNEGQNNITNLKKQYAMLLTSIYENYNEAVD